MGGRFSLAIALSAVAAATSFAVEPAEPKPALGSEEDPPNLAESHFQFYQDLLQSEVSRDWAAAFENLTLAAHFGHSAAQHSLAAAYATGLFHGLRVPMDPGRFITFE